MCLVILTNMNFTESKLVIRKARRKDRHSMKACNERNLPENYNLGFWEKMLLLHPGYSFVLEDPSNHDLKGYILCDEKTIISMAVDSNVRKQGWGEKLLRSALAMVPLDTSVELQVRKSNLVAQKLYKKLGFEITDEIEHYYVNPTEDAFQMTRKIK